MNKALICVDVQPDFLPGGPLGVENGHQVIPNLIELMNDVDIIVLTQDWHPENHISFSTDPEYQDGSWPMHCVQGTPGAHIDHELFHAAVDTGKPVLIVHKGENADREAYSGFDGRVVNQYNLPGENLRDSTLAIALSYLSVRKVLIGGLALDYCVKATAMDARKSFQSVVYVDATRSVDVLSGINAVVEMGRAGVELATRRF
jgi:nicotinamidase/pyrazinamidase